MVRVVGMMALMASLLGLGTLGCANTQFLGATQVGGAEDATWVFVDTDDNVKSNGVYRCRDDGSSVTCQRAKIIK